MTVTVAMSLAWQPLISRATVGPRSSAPSARIKNAASEGAADWNQNPSLRAPKKAIGPDRPDMSSPQQASSRRFARCLHGICTKCAAWGSLCAQLTLVCRVYLCTAPKRVCDLSEQTFDALCRMCGVAVGRDAAIDFDGFVLAFEQLYNRGASLSPPLRQYCTSSPPLHLHTSAAPPHLYCACALSLHLNCACAPLLPLRCLRTCTFTASFLRRCRWIRSRSTSCEPR